ncbi:MAG: hypothetical protein C0432_05950 [Candidatus Puniceispirillum sp.]|nr:hypothetical protein [Candidatus Pelagibacter sp.]MBA4283817.1 hypothetical protein [Candidatus Puniceispirillum sp.]
MSQFDREPIMRTGSSVSIDQGLRTFMSKVYGYMMLGLLITGISASLIASNPQLLMAIFSSPLQYVLLFAPFGLVMFLQFRIHKIQSSTAQLLFLGYAALLGMSLSVIFISYKLGSVFNIFLVSASVFGTMSLYGYTTKKDLTSMGSFLFMALIGLIVASLINIFMRNSMMDMLLSCITVLIFTGLTAYDTQMIKQIYYDSDSYEVGTKKAVIGALALYLDFINIFLSLLRLFGERK